MAFQLKYWYRFKDKHNQTYTVNILENTEDTLIPIEIEGAASPFSVNYPELANKIDTVRGSGANLNVISVTDRQFSGLYTADMLKYKVTVYKGASLVWTGYLDSELYSEPFSELRNYFVNLKANDGFNLLDRLYYVQANGLKYSGLQTQWEVLTNIFAKLGLNYNAVYVGLSTSIDGVTLAAGETILHRTIVNVANYLNEDKEPETCRTVLEATLKPYGAFVQQINGALYISDLNIIASDAPVTFKKFNSTFSFIGTESINPNIGEIYFSSNDSNLDTVNGINEQRVIYSPYKQQTLYEGKVEQSNIAGTTTEQAFAAGSSQYSWKETYYPENTDFEVLDTAKAKFVFMQGTGSKNSSSKDYYLKLSKTGTSFTPAVKLKNIDNYLQTSATNFLKISCKGFVRTKDKLGDDGEAGTPVFNFQVPVLIKVGEFTCNYEGVWTKNVTPPYDATKIAWLHFQTEKETLFTDTWIDNRQYVQYNSLFDEYPPLYQIIPLKGLLDLPGLESSPYGVLEVSILSDYRAFAGAGPGDVTASLKDVRLQDIEISIVNGNGETVNNDDIEYIGRLNPKFKNSGEPVSLIHGTNFNDNSTELGGLMKAATAGYNFIKSWTREGISDRLERLLLRSIQSNYTFPSLKITGTIDKPSSLFGYMVYTGYIEGKKMMITGSTIDYETAEASCSLIEFNKDNLTIV